MIMIIPYFILQSFFFHYETDCVMHSFVPCSYVSYIVLTKLLSLNDRNVLYFGSTVSILLFTHGDVCSLQKFLDLQMWYLLLTNSGCTERFVGKLEPGALCNRARLNPWAYQLLVRSKHCVKWHFPCLILIFRCLAAPDRLKWLMDRISSLCGLNLAHPWVSHSVLFHYQRRFWHLASLCSAQTRPLLFCIWRVPAPVTPCRLNRGTEDSLS